MTDIINLCVGSNNPVKINAAIEAFSLCFSNHKIIAAGMHAPSKVADQPMTEAETRLGAENRALFCEEQDTLNAYDFYLAMEGGVDTFPEGAATFAYVTIIDRKGVMTTGRTANLPIPDSIYDQLKNGLELGNIMDERFNTENVKQKGGAIGLFTNQAATRQSIYSQALVLALAPTLHPNHYK